MLDVPMDFNLTVSKVHWYGFSFPLQKTLKTYLVKKPYYWSSFSIISKNNMHNFLNAYLHNAQFSSWTPNKRADQNQLNAKRHMRIKQSSIKSCIKEICESEEASFNLWNNLSRCF